MGQYKKSRYVLLDQIRGFAVLLMIIFHFAYDLNIYKFVNIDFQKDIFWWVLPRVIVTLFLLAMGISLSVVHGKKIYWPKFLKRFGLIALYALIISLVTFFTFRSNWVYFGTLHCIAVSGLISLMFLPYPKISLVIGLSLLIPSVFFDMNIPFFIMRHQSMDYIPIFPWIGIVFIGIFLHSVNFHNKNLPFNIQLRPIAMLGQHALKIYILHQPILYGLISLFYFVKMKM